MESHVMARSLKGHAATSGVDKWVAIQENTFRNWVNEQLRIMDMEVNNLEEDFDSGVRLCALIEALQGKRIRVIKNPKNHHQQLANVAEALNAIANDNIRLVNIGPEDIVNGNLKLILGLIWHLILRYQIGKSKFPTKKLMLAWLQAVIPDCNIQNFTSDWNDGIALHALIDWCKPGLCPDWRHMSRSDRLENCRDAMTLAKTHFDIPLVVRPEDLSSADLDELSGMTYLSYFMKLDSPGYHQTLNLVRRLLRHGTVSNFTSDWNDGRLLCNLVTSVGGSVSGWPTMTGDTVENMQRGMDAAQALAPKGIQPILSAKEMCDPEVDHIGIMAYAAYFTTFKPVRSAEEKVVFSSLPQNVSVGQEASFSIHLEDEDVSAGDIRAEVHGPDSRHNVHFNWVGRKGEGYFTPTETGLHKLHVYCENQMINGCPASFKVLADRSKVSLTRVERCTVGHLTELQVNSSEAGQGEVRVEARAPSGRSINLSPVPRHGNYVTNFNPTEVGDWEISVMYDDDHIYGSPYTIQVYDPSQVKIYGLEGGTVGTGLTFNADATRAGSGDLRVKVLHEGVEVRSRVYMEQNGLYKVDFTPEGSGSYSVEVYFNDEIVRGSPYTVDIVDSSNVTVSGEGLSLVRVNKTATFEINTGSTSGKVECEITSPSGGRVPCHVNKMSSGSHTVQYIPQVAGDHKVTVFYCGQKVKGSPFLSHAFDAGKVVVSNMPHSGMVGKPVTFDIDASKAGRGNIEIMVDDGTITCQVQSHGNNRFTASYMPTAVEEHLIKMTFNSLPVNGSPWKVAITDPSKMSATGMGLDYVHVHRLAWFDVHTVGKPTSVKDLNVVIRAPSGHSIPCNIVQGTREYRVEYTPMEVGDHRIEVKYADQDLTDSPFTARAYDTSAIRVTPLSDGVVGQPVHFTIDVRNAGEGQLEIMVNSGNLPNTVESDEVGVYKISFVPETAGTQTVDIMFNKEAHPLSAFTCNAVDLRSASVRNLDVELPVDRAASFYIHSEAVGQAIDAKVDVYSPSGKDVAVRYKREGSGVERIEYTPKEVGKHKIDVTYLGAHIDNSPYEITTYSPKLVHLSKMPLGILGIPFKFRVLADHAGEGKVEVTVKSDGDTIPSELEALGEGAFEVSFMGEGETIHTLDITFNGEHIPGSPVSINFADVDKLRLKKPHSELLPCNMPINVKLTAAETAMGDLFATLLDPLDNRVPVKFRPVDTNMYSIDWIPACAGTYDLDVTYGNVIPVWGSPMKLKVYDASKVRLLTTNEKPVVGERYFVKVDVRDAGEGDLGVIIMCDGETVQSAVSQGIDGLIYVSFEVKQAKPHKVYVTYNGEPVPGSPMYIHMQEDQIDALALAMTRQNTKHFLVQELKSLWILMQALRSQLPFTEVVMYITAPNNEMVHADLVDEGSGQYRVEWTPRMAGRYKIDIQVAGSQIEGSPFYVDVFDLNSIRIDNFRHGIVGDPARFSVDFSAAGTLEHEIEIINPSGIAVSYDTSDLGHMWQDYIYEPEEPGNYKIYVKYGGFEVPGCPFIQSVDDGGMPTASGAGLYLAEVDKPAIFTIDCGRQKGDLGVNVKGSNNIPIRNSVNQQADGTFIVTYIPVDTGYCDINVTWKGQDIPGSPYGPKVVDSRRVRIIGGWQHFMDSNERVNLTVGELKQLPFDIADAGPGVLRAEVSGPSGSIDVDIDTYTPGKNIIEFTPQEEGNHYIHIFWSDYALMNSPFLGYAVPQHVDASKIILTGRGLREAVVREEADFMIDGSQAGQGTPEVTLTGIKAEVNVRIVSVGNGRFKCSYIPVVPGAYLLHINWNGRQLRGSPYKVNVIGAFYPNKVIVSGEGIHGGLLGREIDVRIDTRKAGPGELTAYCMGPRQVAVCELADNHDGTFRLGIRPKESGRHVLQVKYGGEHVQGSPFVIKVTAQPDASKVRVVGPGVEHGILATFVSRFIVETKGAGAGQLTVRIRGPKGGFQVEMYRDSQRDRTILCRYDPTECGLYIISVKWSGMDVPGSPFHVHILDTQEELEQVLNEVSYSVKTGGSHGGSQHSQHGIPQPVPQRLAYSQWREAI